MTQIGGIRSYKILNNYPIKNRTPEGSYVYTVLPGGETLKGIAQKAIKTAYNEKRAPGLDDERMDEAMKVIRENNVDKFVWDAGIKGWKTVDPSDPNDPYSEVTLKIPTDLKNQVQEAIKKNIQPSNQSMGPSSNTG